MTEHFREWPLCWAACVLLVAALACNIPTTPPAEEPGSATPPAGTPTGEQPGDAPVDTPTTAPPTGTGEAESAEPEAGTTGPAGSIAPEPPSLGELLFETDFRYWPDFEQDSGFAQSVDGGYRLQAQQYYLWGRSAEARHSAFYAEVKARPEQCPAARGYYGIMFHYQEKDVFRAAVVSCSGRYALLERAGPDRTTTLVEGKLPDEVDPGSGTHRIGVLAVNNTLKLYVDDYPLVRVDVSDMPTGDIGPYVETGDSPISVLFTRLSVYAPG
jgi:hypothetical protein